jgi:hypothetical protein
VYWIVAGSFLWFYLFSSLRFIAALRPLFPTPKPAIHAVSTPEALNGTYDNCPLHLNVSLVSTRMMYWACIKPAQRRAVDVESKFMT